MFQLTTIQRFFDKGGIVSIILCCFFIPLSTSLSGTTAILATTCWLLSGKARETPVLFRHNITIKFSLILFLLMIIGMFYAPIPFSESLAGLKKYRELIYFTVAISLLKDNLKMTKFAENGFVLGCIVLMVISYGIYFSILPSHRYGYSIVYHITHSFFMSLLAFWSIERTFSGSRYRFIWVLVCLLASANLFYITPGRTGMFVYLVLLGLAVVQRLSWQRSILAFAIILTLLTGIFLTSHNFSSRVEEAIHEIQNYHAEVSRTSLGMRFDWWQNSIELIRQKPIFGHGTGSFEVAQAQIIKGTNTEPTDNPHNEYLMIAEQVGIVGLLLFIGILVSLAVSTCRMMQPEKFLLQGVVVAMASGCLMNSLLLDSLQGHFFAFLAAVLSAKLFKNTLGAGKI
jgi:O-antigen ligase